MTQEFWASQAAVLSGVGNAYAEKRVVTKTCTLSTLVEDTGETPRVMQHWTDMGVLRVLRSTSRKGRGNRRFYRAEPLYGERKFALVAQALVRLRLPLGDVKIIVDLMRDGKFIPLFHVAHAAGPDTFAFVEAWPHRDTPYKITVRQGEAELLNLMSGKISPVGVLLNLSKIFKAYKARGPDERHL